MEAKQFRVTMSRRGGYAFSAGFDDESWPAVMLDEPPPLGEGGAPNPTRVLGAAVGACLASSLLFCLGKARVEVGDLTATVEGTVARSDEGRLRITEMRVTLSPSVAEADRDRIQRCVSLFEDFCTVTASVRKGIPVHVEVAATSTD
jgi:uncharacterized OsmC-like protein